VGNFPLFQAQWEIFPLKYTSWENLPRGAAVGEQWEIFPPYVQSVGNGFFLPHFFPLAFVVGKQWEMVISH